MAVRHHRFAPSEGPAVGERTHAKEIIHMKSITVAPARALNQEKATDLVPAGIVVNTPRLSIGNALHDNVGACR